MAITIATQPKDYQPIHTPLYLEAVSSNTANIDFKYKVQISLAVFGVVLRTIYVSPRPADAWLEIDLATHLRDYIFQDNFTLPTPNNFIGAPHVEYSIRIEEHWDGVDRGTFVILSGLTATNVVLDRQEWLQNRATNYDRFHIKENGNIVLPLIPKLLINKSLGSPMYKDEFYYIHVVGRTDFDWMQLRVTQYDEAGNILVPYYISSANAGTATARAVFAKLDLSLVTWNPLVKRIGIDIIDGNNNQVTEQKLFDVQDYECTPWERWKLVYVDKYGSLNNFSLDMISSSDFEVKSKTYNKRMSPAANVDTVRQRGVTKYVQRTEEKFLLNTNLLNEAQSEQILDLLESFVVYRDVRNVDGWGASDFLPVTILTVKAKPYAPGANDMPQYAIEMRYSFERNTRHE